MANREKPLDYAGYLKLPRLLSCQARESERQGRPAHDEMLFIIVHQAYELWFKQVLFELDAVQDILGRPAVDDRDLGRLVNGLRRIVEIEKLLIQQLDVLETMTPLDFLEFRDLLFPASGFQSLQFRLIETRLGLTPEERVDFGEQPYDTRLAPAERRRLREAQSQPTLRDQVQGWLERTPFVDLGDYRFQDAYRRAVTDMLEGDAALVRDNPALGDDERRAELESLAAARARFEAIFDPDRDLIGEEAGRLSWRALQAALFINLYRDEPVLQQPFRLLSRLMDVDESLTTWRYRHALMAQRMIGAKVGTGGSSGHDYLRRTAERHRVFADLFALSSYFIPRSKLPALPPEVRRAMGYRYSEEPG
ncbi:MAG: tryptophan 2,3-dioxygenase family protein [Kiloniellales bacterium]